MSERLIVKNFLCLKDIDLQIKDFLILIGPQAAGKSLCAKLVYFFKTITEEIVLYGMKNALNKEPGFNRILQDKFEFFFPRAYWQAHEFNIEYQRTHKTLFAIEKKDNQELAVSIDPWFNEYARNTEQLFYKAIDPEKNTEKARELLKILNDKYMRMNSSLARNIFIPAGRSFFALLQNSIFKLLRTNNPFDPFLVEFGIFYEDIRQLHHGFIPAMAVKITQSILKGSYMPEGNMLQLEDGRKISLELSSSGQQEALPLALVFSYLFSLKLESYDFANIYIEEPEAHLFPDAQEGISRLISLLKHNSKQEINFFITTHSPYMLTAFNNLILAGNIVKQNPKYKEAVCKIIPESMHVDIDCFSAYSLADGKAVSIINRENNIIDAETIDGVSESIGETFSKLLDIEFENKGNKYV